MKTKMSAEFSLVRITILIAVLFAFGSAQAQEVTENLPLTERLDYTFERYSNARETPGAAAEVMIGNEHVWSGVYGISHEDVPIDANSLFAIGSHTKTIIATIILQLYQEGLLDLQDQIGKFLPDYENIDRHITIHQLLNHTSGIRDFLDYPPFWSLMKRDPGKYWTFDEQMEFVLKPYFKPGERGSYTSTGYLILGQIIEHLTGNSVKEEMQTRIFDPLGLKHTFYLPDDSVYKDLVHPWEGGTDNFAISATQSNFSLFSCAGGIISTPYETAEMFSAILYRNEFLNDTVHALFFDEDNMEDCGVASMGTYGYGLFSAELDRYSEKTNAYGHVGIMRYSWMSRTIVVPEDSVAISMIFNTLTEPKSEVLYTAVINQPPEDITLEYLMSGSAPDSDQWIAKFMTDDPNRHPFSDYSYTLVDGDGTNDSDNSCFAIDGGRYLKNMCPLESGDIQTYTVRVKCNDGYGGSLTKSLQVNLPVGADNHWLKENIKLYPNPTTDILTVEVSIPIHGELEIYNLNGQLIYTRPILSTSEQIDMNSYAKGIYFVTVRSDAWVRTEKIVKY